MDLPTFRKICKEYGLYGLRSGSQALNNLPITHFFVSTNVLYLFSFALPDAIELVFSRKELETLSPKKLEEHLIKLFVTNTL